MAIWIRSEGYSAFREQIMHTMLLDWTLSSVQLIEPGMELVFEFLIEVPQAERSFLFSLLQFFSSVRWDWANSLTTFHCNQII